jgi:heat shock protein beta-11|eukprot:CAMPEP_0174286026 /NCGR_PEP_ID=MMETSP0809-20121228/10440_1 /TAXON_ID=73025 ORGANISM="Eutreptiella gymnastica-like, Strain CCMP1594" /NCGR_SAMPLE_ID=MMETSP0809 /ASSEMBLY_ACC=CAM_ASM_000658 /LENGTH=117 /DNA_ID=CAMNT_0015381943 /DNA_START=150 /DNA_END=503 /DNA_ORIENTATION=+
MIDGDEKTFWITTGMYPHEVLLGFKGATATVTKIRTWSYHIKKLTVEKCTEAQPTKFEKIVETELSDKAGAMQIESFTINSTMGPDVKYLKIHVASGWEDFSSIHSIIVEGDTVEAS